MVWVGDYANPSNYRGLKAIWNLARSWFTEIDRYLHPWTFYFFFGTMVGALINTVFFLLALQAARRIFGKSFI